MAQNPVEHVKDLMKNFSTGMFITHQSNEKLHSRPMQIAESTDEGQVRFATSLKSPKVVEIEANSHVNLVFQNSSQFLSLAGTAQVEKNRQLIEHLWSESWEVWFPAGKDDPDICIVTITPDEAEFWDNSGTRGLAYVFKAAKAYLQSEKPEEDPDAHAKIKM